MPLATPFTVNASGVKRRHFFFKKFFFTVNNFKHQVQGQPNDDRSVVSSLIFSLFCLYSVVSVKKKFSSFLFNRCPAASTRMFPPFATAKSLEKRSLRRNISPLLSKCGNIKKMERKKRMREKRARCIQIIFRMPLLGRKTKIKKKKNTRSHFTSPFKPHAMRGNQKCRFLSHGYIVLEMRQKRQRIIAAISARYVVD